MGMYQAPDVLKTRLAIGTLRSWPLLRKSAARPDQ